MINSATIRNENSYTVVDAVVDGVERSGWVVYDRQGVAFQAAAIQYLIGAGCQSSNIEVAISRG